MALAGSANLEEASAVYEALYQDVFAQSPMGYVADELARNAPCEGGKLVVPVVQGAPRMSAWAGSKAVKDLRAFVQDIPVYPYEATIGLNRLQVTTDKSGVIADSIRAFLSKQKKALDDLLVSKFVANTWTGYDGVSLLNDSHPYSNSTGDNLTTSALTYTTFRAAIEAMADFTDEDGTPLDLFPTHLLVGQAQIRSALEIVGADRPMAVSNAGAFDGTSNVVGAVTIPNVFQGMVKVIQSTWITGNQWAIAHVSPGMAPFTIATHRAIEPIVKDGRDMTSDSRFFDDKFYYSLEGDLGFGPGQWQCIYGSVTA